MPRTPARRRAFLSLAIIGILAAAGLTSCSTDGSVQAKVVRVVDGDTFEAEYSGQKKTVRLLNVNAPETKHPNKVVQCQGPEATRFLEGKLPAGKAVTLRFDEEKTDKYDRALATVFIGDELVNASIARVGLGVAESFAPNTKYFDHVKAAQDEAQAKKAGLLQDNLPCSPAAIAEQLLAALGAVPADPGANATSAVISSAAGTLLTAITAVRAAERTLNGAHDAVVVTARGTAKLAESTGNVTAALANADSRHKVLTARAATVKADEDRKAAEAKADEEKRKADEAAKAAEEARAKAAAEAEAAALAAAPAAVPAPQAPSYQPPSQQYIAPAPAPAPVKQNPYPGYTGPRCYAPGGKSWTPCPERRR